MLKRALFFSTLCFLSFSSRGCAELFSPARYSEMTKIDVFLAREEPYYCFANLEESGRALPFADEKRELIEILAANPPKEVSYDKYRNGWREKKDSAYSSIILSYHSTIRGDGTSYYFCMLTDCVSCYIHAEDNSAFGPSSSRYYSMEEEVGTHILTFAQTALEAEGQRES